MFQSRSKLPGFMIAAPRSGSGKTTVTLGVLRALYRRGLTVQPFKCGPDYIDPAFHQAACNRPSYNLDSFAMRRESVMALLAQSNTANAVVIEGAMGLFDGVATPGAWGTGASADIAAVAGLPVVLVIDVSGQSQTAAAAARGFQGFRPGVNIAGVILNRVASPRHERLARLGFDEAGMRVFGALPRKDSIVLPERHLGLVQAAELTELSSCLDGLADLMEAHADVGGLLATGTFDPPDAQPSALNPPGQRIALASDTAFSFTYPHIAAAWRSAGAEILPFSPLADEAPVASADAVWLPGGYPELHAGRLASNTNFIGAIRGIAQKVPIHGECGGYMMLGDGLIDARGERHAMLGLLPLETSFARRELHLGYRRGRLLNGCALGNPGSIVYGHEFHYCSVVKEQGDALFELSDADGALLLSGGLRMGTVTGSFFHMIDAYRPDQATEIIG
jgi:cobyrinic acid a,c-diamide synthase